jgi:predicted RNA binding protein YcfA (HicA-like mRNA interferase family)
MSSTAMVKLVMNQGYSIVPGGKGSHIKLRADGRPMIIIPTNRESLSPKVLANTATALGLPSLGALRTIRQ